MGAAGGGVWKTENAGQTWNNLSDSDFNTGTIGAIAVAPSDPNVVYVGTGESPIRGVTTSHGDGVYRSDDAGATWTHTGLEATRQISALVVHPTDPKTAWVAAQGNPWAANKERGIFKTSDGGKTWTQTLKVDDRTGASDLVIDPGNPRVLYAGMWHHGRNPWFITSGDTSGGIYKSVDGGDTWTELTAGLPDLVGKIGVAVAPSNPDKVYAIVEAEEGGLFVSSNGGGSWSRQNDTRLIQARAWYYNHIGVDPLDENTVYIMNAPLLKSIDGGKTFAPMRAPHGDHHDMWFNPENSDNFINANDGGATITFDGGNTWSSIYNQPTAQFYRVITDNLTPFSVYGGQQDNTTMAIRSDAFDGSIGRDDLKTIGGGESAHVAFDPDNPRLIYATTINATLTEFDAKQERTRLIKPYPEYVFGRDVKDHKYRYNWNAPVIVSLHDPSTIYYGAQVLLRSQDRGQTWTEVSPDLTKNDPEHQGQGGGPITNEQAGAEFYNTIFTIEESQHAAGTIWVGSDDGLVHLTQDGGETWTNVTPSGVGEALINAIEISPHDPATAYLAVTGYKMNDFKPYIYRTTDYGRSWKRLDKGLPADTFVRVVREDPEREGLLYAGTEAGMFVSFSATKPQWQRMRFNLPPVPITDIEIRQNSLVIATQGRGFYLLDDLTPIQSYTDDIANSDFYLNPTERFVRSAGGFGNVGSGDPEAGVRPRGMPIQFVASEALAEQDPALSITIKDDAGTLIRQYDSEKSANDLCRERVSDPRSPVSIDTPSLKAGMNTWTWDTRREALRCVDGVHIFAGYAGPSVPPGTYQVTVTAGEETSSYPFELVADPREDGTQADYTKLEQHVSEAYALLNTLLKDIDLARVARAQLKEQLTIGEKQGKDVSALQGDVDKVIEQFLAWEDGVTQRRHRSFDDDINWPNNLDVQIQHVMAAMDSAGVPVTEGALERLSDLKSAYAESRKQLDEISQSVETLNQKLAKQGLSPVPLP
ncbi:MAG: glycosyl hydrolase [Parvularculaceae bacterium]|nr:glycosyl hydrolase [Parvularculaceae bacterium]